MNKKLFYFSALILLFIFSACDESEKASANGLQNTLGDSSVGNGKEGNSEDYFYDFENEINVTFNRYDFNNLQLGSFDPTKDTMNFRTFPDFLLEVDPDDPSLPCVTCRDLIGIVQDTTRLDSVTISSTQFKNVNGMLWDLNANPEFQRYKPTPSSWQYTDTTIVYTDTLNYYHYRAILDTVEDDGITFVDTTEWVDTDASYTNPEQFQFDVTFSFQRKVLNSDSLMFRVNQDCNENGAWDPAENFQDANGDGVYNPAEDQFVLATDDLGNGLWDREEVYYDTNGNGVWDLSEPFEDRNCNGFRDAEESYTDTNGNGSWDDGEPFVDEGNGMWDRAELFTDLNGNGAGDPGELYNYGLMPNNLIVSYDNYPDLSDPRIVIEVQPGEDVTTYRGEVFTDLIKEIVFEDNKTRLVDDVDSLVVLTTNQTIDYAPEQFAGGDYYITKTQYEYLDVANNVDVREYDYHLYKENGHIYKLIHPSYFLPAGYYFAPEQVEGGFWFEEFASDEIQFYTPGGRFRDGERVETDTTITTAVAVYNVHRIISVDADSVVVPAKKVRGFMDNGTPTCYPPNGDLIVGDLDECLPADTTFYDAFRVNRLTAITMIGNGIEYTEDVDTWLVKDYGIVKEDLSIGWTGVDAIEYSRLEMVEFNEIVNRSLMRNLTGGPAPVDLDHFQDQGELDNDAFEPHRTAGFSRVIIPNR